MKAVKVIGFILLGLLVLVAAAGTYVKVALPDTGAAPQIKIERTAERIKRGEYLANHVSACMDCHSTKDERLYGSPVVGGFGAGGEKFDQLLLICVQFPQFKKTYRGQKLTSRSILSYIPCRIRQIWVSYHPKLIPSGMALTLLTQRLVSNTNAMVYVCWNEGQRSCCYLCLFSNC